MCVNLKQSVYAQEKKMHSPTVPGSTGVSLSTYGNASFSFLTPPPPAAEASPAVGLSLGFLRSPGVPEVPWGLSGCQPLYTFLLALGLLTTLSLKQRSPVLPAAAFLLASGGHVGLTPPVSLSHSRAVSPCGKAALGGFGYFSNFLSLWCGLLTSGFWLPCLITASGVTSQAGILAEALATSSS